MSLQVMRGNIFDQIDTEQYDVLIHGCNCMNTMEAGIAKQIKKRFPEAYAVDRKTIKGSKDKLGTCTMSLVQLKNGKHFFIVNAYTQYAYGKNPNAKYADLKALASCLKQVQKKLGDPRAGRKIIMPKIGCGYGNLDWQSVKGVIDETLKMPVTVCDLN